MCRLFFLIIFGLNLFFGCTTAKHKYQTFYDPEYRVLDRGELDVKVKSQACSETFEDAFSAAKNNSKYHLRSVIGNKNHEVKFKEVGSYITNDKICVEMSASSFPYKN